MSLTRASSAPSGSTNNGIASFERANENGIGQEELKQM